MGSLDNRHWQGEDYRQRMTPKDWKEFLLNSDDTIIYHGRLRQLKAKRLGFGVVEIYKEPLKEEA